MSHSSEPAPISSQTIRFEEGRDYVVENDAQLPFRLLANLGTGHTGVVEKIEDTITKAVFARKVIRIRATKDRSQKEQIFRNEVNIIRSFKRHHHIIGVFATYMAQREFGLILQPVADEGDLDSFLGIYWANYRHEQKPAASAAKVSIDGVYEAMTATLEHAIGCLANGLAFMHQNRIRHKDIKPQNVLVHKGSIIYTDFGYSLDSSQLSGSTTEGRPTSFTRRYSAPEVIKQEPRNSRSDVYSLGCVFLEILSALLGNKDFSPDATFSEMMQQIHEQLSYSIVPLRLFFMVNIITSMTDTVPAARVTARLAADMIMSRPGFCCRPCQATLIAEESDQSAS